MSAVWKGSSTSLTNPSRREQTTTRDGVIEVTLTLDGKYADLVTIHNANPPGTALAEYAGAYVTERNLKRDGKGDLATLTIKGSSGVDPAEFSGGGTAQDTLEVDYVRVDEDLRYHRLWAGTSPAGSTYQISQTDRETIERKLQDPSNTETLGTAAQELYDRLLRGQTHYAKYIPVVRKTTSQGTTPTTGGVGQRDTGTAIANGGPAQNANGVTLTYIKTADRKVKQGGRWQRHQEWTGFELVDNLVVDNT